MTDQQQEIIDTLVTALQNLIEFDMIKDPDGDHMQEIAVALAMARGDITPDAPADGHALANAAIDAAMAYEVQCPVCHSKTDVYHDVWAVVRCPVALCTGEIINPHPDPDNVLTDVERAELDALNTQRSLERAKLILGNKHAVL